MITIFFLFELLLLSQKIKNKSKLFRGLCKQIRCQSVSLCVEYIEYTYTKAIIIISKEKKTVRLPTHTKHLSRQIEIPCVCHILVWCEPCAYAKLNGHTSTLLFITCVCVFICYSKKLKHRYCVYRNVALERNTQENSQLARAHL